MIESVLHTIREELSDLADAPAVTRVCVRLIMAALLGGLLGYEREHKHKSAGLRTHMLVAIGSALFVLVPQQAGATTGDMTRVLQGLVAGIGFLGAGAIIHNNRRKETDEPQRQTEGEVKGLTTAAGIWLTAAIGMSAGMGREVTAVLSTILALIVLAALPKIDDKVR